MLNNRNGQAKILTVDEIYLLLKFFPSARDRAFFMFCLYTACRISEARQMPWRNVFHQGTVLEEIVIPKEITKGKQGTRTIPTHPSLAKFLKQYYEESLALVKLKDLTGGWSSWSGIKDGKLSVNQYWGCPKCKLTLVIKHGNRHGEQRYLCKICRFEFSESTAIRNEVMAMTPIIDCDFLGVKSSNNFGLLFADSNNPFLFPGKGGKGCLSIRAALSIFENAYAKAGIVGAGSHSCRRTALSWMHSAGIPLRVLQEISGHRDLGALQRYLEASEEEVLAAIQLLR